MIVQYYYSATIGIKTEDISILCDPWFTQGAYDGSWYHFPNLINDPIKKIGKYDFIFISHIHPDHYDPCFLKEYLTYFPFTRIIIGDFDVNILSREMTKDNIQHEIIDTLTVQNTCFKIIPCHSHKYDIDSALIVTDGKTTVANMNDNPYYEPQLDKVLAFSSKIDFALLPFAGAGPYPQTYYDLNDPILSQRMAEKENRFIREYLDFINYLNPKKSLPFAGSYVIGGKLSYLNAYRGVPDAFKILTYDPNAILLDDGGDAYYDTEQMCASKIRSTPYEQKELDLYLMQISTLPMNYEKDFSSIDFSKINLIHLLRITYSNALQHSLCAEDYYYCFWINNQYAVLNVNPNNVLFTVETSVDNYSPRSEMYIDPRYLFGLLLKTYHWNTAEVGSHMMVRRYPDQFDRQVQLFINYLFIEKNDAM